jgi:hypothetical protein
MWSDPVSSDKSTKTGRDVKRPAALRCEPRVSLPVVVFCAVVGTIGGKLLAPLLSCVPFILDPFLRPLLVLPSTFGSSFFAIVLLLLCLLCLPTQGVCTHGR